MTNIAINGFGRIGRLVLRILVDKIEHDPKFKHLVLVAVNNPAMEASYAAYKLKYDSKHGRFPGTVDSDDENNILLINKKHRLQIFHERDPAKLCWRELQIDYVIESAGIFTTLSGCHKHIEAGAKKVLITAPSKDAPVYVYGVNHELYTADQEIVSNASCTTNCLAPLMKVIDKHFGVSEALMTTIHSMTASQKTVDGTSRKDWRGGRCASDNLIPSSTGAASMVGLVLPHLQGKLTGLSVRVPTTDVSLVDVSIRLKVPIQTMDDVMHAVEIEAAGELEGIVGVTKDAVVSSDFISDTHSSVYDSKAAIMLNPTFIKVLAWYDNEYGYSARVVDLLGHMITVDSLV